jgi:hypothetical protein
VKKYAYYWSEKTLLKAVRKERLEGLLGISGPSLSTEILLSSGDYSSILRRKRKTKPRILKALRRQSSAETT